MRGFLALLLLAVVIQSAVARPPQPYVGAALQYGAIAELHKLTYVPVNATANAMTSTANNYYTSWHGGLGGQVEGGVMGDFWSAYLGLREATGHKTYHPHWNLDWYSTRLLLGSRLRVSDRSPNPVKPLIGAGLSLGWMTRHYDHDGRSGSQTSADHVGWYGEFGFLVQPRTPWGVSLLFHFGNPLQRLTGTTDGELNRTDGFREVGMELGFIYRLGR